MTSLFSAYTNTDIQAMMNAIDDNGLKNHINWYWKKPRARALVLLLANSGIGLGAISTLTVHDLIPIENCYMIKINKDRVDEQTVYCNPQTRQKINQWLSVRPANIKDDLLFGIPLVAVKTIIHRLIVKTGVGNPKKYTLWNGIPVIKYQKSLVLCMNNRFLDILLKHSLFDIQSFEDYKKIIPDLEMDNG